VLERHQRSQGCSLTSDEWYECIAITKRRKKHFEEIRSLLGGIRLFRRKDVLGGRTP